MMMMNALAPMARAFGDDEYADKIDLQGKAILSKTIGKYWDSRRKLFVDNLPWSEEEGGIRLSDRTLSMALIHDLIPGDEMEQIIEALENPPNTMGLSMLSIAKTHPESAAVLRMHFIQVPQCNLP